MPRRGVLGNSEGIRAYLQRLAVKLARYAIRDGHCLLGRHAWRGNRRYRAHQAKGESVWVSITANRYRTPALRVRCPCTIVKEEEGFAGKEVAGSPTGDLVRRPRSRAAVLHYRRKNLRGGRSAKRGEGPRGHDVRWLRIPDHDR